VKFVECAQGDKEEGAVHVQDPEAIDIVARVLMCNVLDEHYEYESGMELLNNYAGKYGEDASYENFTDKEVQLVA
jgi:hypothetical protein